jgi:alkylation response protein AidB-like acyl-CoA dehydrogenase
MREWQLIRLPIDPNAPPTPIEETARPIDGLSLFYTDLDRRYADIRKIDKMGNHSSDTAELVLDDVRVPVRYTIGEEGRGFQMQMAQFQDERLWICYMAVTGARRAIDRTIEYLQVREAFGKPLLSNQYIQYTLSELVAEIDILHGFLQGIQMEDECISFDHFNGFTALVNAVAVVELHGSEVGE